MSFHSCTVHVMRLLLEMGFAFVNIKFLQWMFFVCRKWTSTSREQEKDRLTPMCIESWTFQVLCTSSLGPDYSQVLYCLITLYKLIPVTFRSPGQVNHDGFGWHPLQSIKQCSCRSVIFSIPFGFFYLYIKKKTWGFRVFPRVGACKL
jgi:hypothetical protein